MKNIVLATESPAKHETMSRLMLTFTTDAAHIDESRFEQEPVVEHVQRLARAKAQTVYARHQEAIVVSTDQVAAIDEDILGKPGNHAGAIAQLQKVSGQRVAFHTGLCVIDNNETQVLHLQFDVRFRQLTLTEIDSYLRQEQPYQCACSFKIESLGINLIDELYGHDVTIVTGLPMLALCKILREKSVL